MKARDDVVSKANPEISYTGYVYWIILLYENNSRILISIKSDEIQLGITQPIFLSVVLVRIIKLFFSHRPLLIIIPSCIYNARYTNSRSISGRKID